MVVGRQSPSGRRAPAHSRCQPTWRPFLAQIFPPLLRPDERRRPRSQPVQGPNDHTIAQIKDAVRDGLRAVKNTIDDGAVVPGAGAFELAAANHLRTVTVKAAEGRCACATVFPGLFCSKTAGLVTVFHPTSAWNFRVQWKPWSVGWELPALRGVPHPNTHTHTCTHMHIHTAQHNRNAHHTTTAPPFSNANSRVKLGVLAFAEALLGVPKILAENSGYDPQEVVIELMVRLGWDAWMGRSGAGGACSCCRFAACLRCSGTAAGSVPSAAGAALPRRRAGAAALTCPLFTPLPERGRGGRRRRV